MYVLNITDEYDKCKNDENILSKNIPTLFLTMPCGLSFLCLISLMIYTFI